MTARLARRTLDRRAPTLAHGLAHRSSGRSCTAARARRRTRSSIRRSACACRCRASLRCRRAASRATGAGSCRSTTATTGRATARRCAWIRALLAREGIDADGEVVLLRLPAHAGLRLQPGELLGAATTRDGACAPCSPRCNNTFGERHHYLVAHADGGAIADGETLEARKVFHVSPFCEVSGHYAFRFHFGADGAGSRASTTSTTTATRRCSRPASPAPCGRSTRGRARALLARYPRSRSASSPASTGRRRSSWAKRVPFFPKPEPPRAALTR